MRNASEEGIQLCKSGKFAESIEKLREHLKSEPADINAHKYLGVAYTQTRHYEEAIGEFLALTRMEPGNATHCYNLGLAYEAFGNDLQAVGAYQKALQLKPDYKKAKDSLSAVTAKQHRVGATQVAAAPTHYQSNQQAYQVQPSQSPFQQPQGQGYQAMPPQQPAYQAPVGGYAPNGQALPIVDNALVWIMAFIPLIGIFTDVLFGIGASFFLGLGYLILVFSDEKKLKQKGFDTRCLNWWWLFVPVWIFKRARLVGGSNNYAITWVLLAVLSIIISASLDGLTANYVVPTSDGNANYSDTSDSDTTASDPGNSNTSDSVSVFTVQDWNFTSGEYSQEITGTIKNDTDKTFSYVQVEFNLYDDAGNQVGSTMANINNLESYGTWSFKAAVLEDNATKARLKGVEGW